METVTPRSFDVNIFRSRNGGATWDAVYELPRSVRHFHEVTYDPYRNRIWVATGDGPGQGNVIFSDDMGDTWQMLGAFGHMTNKTTIHPMPTCVLFGTDTIASSSLTRWVEPLNLENPDPNMEVVYTADLNEVVTVASRGSQYWHSGAVYTAFRERDYRSVLIGTKDGVNFYKLWSMLETPGDTTPKPGLHNIYGPDVNGKMVGLYVNFAGESRLWIADAPTWVEI